jgi:4-oxalocrotonate tautomerase
VQSPAIATAVVRLIICAIIHPAFLETDTMPTYHVEMIEGRTLEQKKKLVEEITRVSVEVLGGSPESVDVLITDVPAHNWATGGQLWSEKLKK